MIRKPPGVEKESKAHAAVGKAIEIGGDVKDVTRKGGQLLGKGCALWFGAVMAFGVVMSDTPIWFKALLLMLGYGIWRLIKAAGQRAQQASSNRHL